MAGYYVREEDGSSHYVLEDGTGDLILEEGFAVISRAAAIGAVAAVTVAGHIEAEVERSVAIAGVAGISVTGTGPFDPSRITQAGVEAVVQALASLRVTQDGVEVLVQPSSALTRVTQDGLEVVVQGLSVARATTAGVETVMFVSRETYDVTIIDVHERDA